MRFILSLLLAVGIGGVCCGAPPSTSELLDKSKTTAASEHKAIFVHFGASWCGWCKRLDAFLEKSEIKPIFDRHFVELKLVVQENPKNKHLENRGSDKLMSALGGPAGLPYFAFLDSSGHLIVNSKQPASSGGDGGNIGYPAKPGEIDWFLQMLRKAAPKISEEELKTVETTLKAQKT